MQVLALNTKDSEPKEAGFQTFYNGPSLECIATDLDTKSTICFRVRAEAGEHSSQWSSVLQIVMEDRRFPDLFASQAERVLESPTIAKLQSTKEWPSPSNLVLTQRLQLTPNTAVGSPDCIPNGVLSPQNIYVSKVSHGLC